MDDDENGGLFAIDVCSSDESTKEDDKVPRDFQSQEEFDRQKRIWRPKIETGELYKTLNLPKDNPSKQESQTILHAIEELYFFGRYGEAKRLNEDVLKGELSREFRIVVEDYLGRCEKKLKLNVGKRIASCELGTMIPLCIR